MYRRYGKTNIPMSVAGILLLLVMLTACLMSGMAAKYTGESDGVAGARVARFDVRILPGSDVNIDGANATGSSISGAYDFKVANYSEVSVSYTIVVTTATPLPSGLQLVMGSQTYATDGSTTGFSFDGGELMYGTEADHSLSIVALLGESGITTDVDQALTVSVTAVQID